MEKSQIVHRSAIPVTGGKSIPVETVEDFIVAVNSDPNIALNGMLLW